MDIDNDKPPFMPQPKWTRIKQRRAQLREQMRLKYLNNYEVLDNGCWRWLGRPDSWGYGQVGSSWGLTGAHRFMYEQLVGPIKGGLELDHLCRNKICVNPEHLQPVAKLTNQRRAGNAKLQRRQVVLMRLMFEDDGRSIRSLAREFGISPTQVRRIVRGHSWKDAMPR